MNINIPTIEFINITKNYFKDSDINIIFEIGSMDGQDSLLFKQHFPNSAVYAIEGLQSNYIKYLINLHEIYTYNIVIFNYDGNIVFHEKDINGIHSVYDRGQNYGTSTLNLECCRIDTFCNRYNINKIDMVKIDVEGATYEILESFGKLLKTVKIMHIETEDYPFFKGQRLDADVTKLLIQNDFELVEKAGCIISEPGSQFDSVWISKNSIKMDTK